MVILWLVRRSEAMAYLRPVPKKPIGFSPSFAETPIVVTASIGIRPGFVSQFSQRAAQRNRYARRAAVEESAFEGVAGGLDFCGGLGG
jgi:hypothetical protein